MIITSDWLTKSPFFVATLDQDLSEYISEFPLHPPSALLTSSLSVFGSESSRTIDRMADSTSLKLLTFLGDTSTISLLTYNRKALPNCNSYK